VWRWPPALNAGVGFSIDNRMATIGASEPVSATFSPDGRRLATWTWGSGLRVWDVASGGLVATLEGREDRISSAAFSPDSTRIVSGSDDGTARIWTLGGTTTVLTGHEGGVTSVAFAPDGQHVASAGADNAVRVWDLDGHSLATLSGHAGRVTTVAFSPTGRELASGSADRAIRLWDAATFTSNGVLNGHTDTITSIAFSPDGRRIVSGSADQTVRFWEPAVGRSDRVIAAVGDSVRQVAVSGDSTRVAVAHGNGAVRVLNLSTTAPPIVCAEGNRLLSPADHKNIGFTPDGRLVSSYELSIRVWDSSNCATLAAWNGDALPVKEELAVSPDGSRVATGIFGGLLSIRDLSTGRVIWQTDSAGMVLRVAYSPDGARIIVAAGRDVRVWNADRPEVVMTMAGHEGNVTAVAVSADGRWIASGSNDRTVRLWRPADGQPVATLTGSDANVSAVAFSPDSTRLVSGGSDRVLRLWDVATHEQILVLQGHQDRVTSLAFTPDGSRIVSGSADGTVRVLDSRLAHDADAAMLAAKLRSTLRFSTEMIDRARTDSTLDPKVKASAIALIEARGDDPSALNQESRRAVETARLPRSAYEVALSRAQLANEAAPWNPEFVVTLGAAYYRLQRYDESLSTLMRAAALRSEPQATELVFIAMAHHQLRHSGEAREALDRARTMLDADLIRVRAAADSNVRALYDEATALINR